MPIPSHAGIRHIKLSGEEKQKVLINISEWWEQLLSAGRLESAALWSKEQQHAWSRTRGTAPKSSRCDIALTWYSPYQSKWFTTVAYVFYYHYYSVFPTRCEYMDTYLYYIVGDEINVTLKLTNVAITCPEENTYKQACKVKKKIVPDRLNNLI